MINKHLAEAQTLFEENGLVSDVIEYYEGFHPTLKGFAERWYEAKKDIMNHLEKSDTVLIKGSHSMNLSEITSFLKEICE